MAATVDSEDNYAACRGRHRAHTCGRARKNNWPESQDSETSQNINAPEDPITDVASPPERRQITFPKMSTPR